jgi:hypothetical protein
MTGVWETCGGIEYGYLWVQVWAPITHTLTKPVPSEQVTGAMGTT